MCFIICGRLGFEASPPCGIYSRGSEDTACDVSFIGSKAPTDNNTNLAARNYQTNSLTKYLLDTKEETIMARNMSRKKFAALIVLISLAGMVLRLTGIYFEGIDYQVCLSGWFQDLKQGGGLKALAEFDGDYNLPYVTALFFLTYLPLEPIISIKLLSIAFDYLGAAVAAALIMEASPEDRRRTVGCLGYAVGLCLPTVVINSGYLAQSDGIWVALSLLSFWFMSHDKPGRGMFTLGCALSMKLQAMFIVPAILIYYWKKKKFSILHLVWIPVAIETLSIPAILAGCGWDIALKVYLRMLGEYPFVYYYYPNIWTFFQNAPYYVFGKIAIALTFVILLVFAVMLLGSKRQDTKSNYIDYIIWTAMTCAMFLPCMHERYNFLAEMLLAVFAVIKPKYRLPAILLEVISFLCYGQLFLDWPAVSAQALAVCNLLIYGYLTYTCVGELFREELEKEDLVVC